MEHVVDSRYQERGYELYATSFWYDRIDEIAIRESPRDHERCLLRSAEQLNEAQYRDEFEERLDVLETLIRDAWMLSLGVDSTQLVNEDLSAELKEISTKLDSSRAADWILQIEDLREQLIVNINRKVTTDALFLAMAGDVPALKRPKIR